MSLLGTGKRILIVEDELVLVMEIEDAVAALGCEVVGPTATLETATRLAEKERVDAAVLDINVRGSKVFPLAELLLARGIPILLASGFSDWALPETLRGQPRVSKPFTCDEMKREIAALFSTGLAHDNQSKVS